MDSRSLGESVQEWDKPPSYSTPASFEDEIARDSSLAEAAFILPASFPPVMAKMDAVRQRATVDLPPLPSAAAEAAAIVSESVLQASTGLPAEVMAAAAAAAAAAVAVVHFFYYPESYNTATEAVVAPSVPESLTATAAVATAHAGSSQSTPVIEGAAGYLRSLVRAELRDIALGRRSAKPRGLTANGSKSWAPTPRKSDPSQQAVHLNSSIFSATPLSDVRSNGEGAANNITLDLVNDSTKSESAADTLTDHAKDTNQHAVPMPMSVAESTTTLPSRAAHALPAGASPATKSMPVASRHMVGQTHTLGGLDAPPSISTGPESPLGQESSLHSQAPGERASIAFQSQRTLLLPIKGELQSEGSSKSGRQGRDKKEGMRPEFLVKRDRSARSAITSKVSSSSASQTMLDRRARIDGALFGRDNDCAAGSSGTGGSGDRQGHMGYSSTDAEKWQQQPFGLGSTRWLEAAELQPAAEKGEEATVVPAGSPHGSDQVITL